MGSEARLRETCEVDALSADFPSQDLAVFEASAQSPGRTILGKPPFRILRGPFRQCPPLPAHVPHSVIPSSARVYRVPPSLPLGASRERVPFGSRLSASPRGLRFSIKSTSKLANVSRGFQTWKNPEGLFVQISYFSP